MKVYFFSKQDAAAGSPGSAEQKEASEAIIKFLKDNGLTVVSNLLSRAGLEQLSFEHMDGLIVEGKNSVAEAGYLIALALAQAKPILYLLPKGAPLPDQLRSLQENKKLRKLFLLHFYTPRVLPNFLGDFIDIIETGELRREVPTIKFTLRFTARANRYLTYQSRKKRISKADYLRQLIDQNIKSDEEYQNNLRKPLEHETEPENQP
ncbi:MAG: hypothetical protein NTZ18_03405 [Candidatus Komeilibacteria bacterium]|nr:hypothetical protein [Candidatus Komeilibacteria bacterium]